MAVQMGLWTCVLLNILWCVAVLDIVPQTIQDACDQEALRVLGMRDLDIYTPVSTPLSSSPASASVSYTYTQTCDGELSLEYAAAMGEISTLPLTKLLTRYHPHYTWVAILVQVFILVSITVSFLTIGTALHHTLRGIVHTYMAKVRDTSTNKTKKWQRIKQWLAVTGLSFCCFVVVFGIAMADPQGFVIILEKLASFTINVEVGVFIFLMLFWANRGKNKSLEIPVPMSPTMHILIFLMPVFFNFAVVLDVYNTVSDLLQLPEVSISTMLSNITNISNINNISASAASSFSLKNTTITGLSSLSSFNLTTEVPLV